MIAQCVYARKLLCSCFPVDLNAMSIYKMKFMKKKYTIFFFPWNDFKFDSFTPLNKWQAAKISITLIQCLVCQRKLCVCLCFFSYPIFIFKIIRLKIPCEHFASNFINKKNPKQNVNNICLRVVARIARAKQTFLFK